VWRHWYVVIQRADGEKLIGPYATRREATRVAEGQSDPDILREYYDRYLSKRRAITRGRRSQ
jgi:hypothetical protein